MLSSRYVGRVGALAVMLGVGTALAAPAWADDNPSGSDSSASSSPSSARSSTTAGPRNGGKAAFKRRSAAGGGGEVNKSPKKSSGAGVVKSASPEAHPAPAAEQKQQQAETKPRVEEFSSTAAIDPVVPEPLSVSPAPMATQAVTRVTGLKVLPAPLASGTNAPAQMQSLFVMLGVARRPTDDGDSPAAATSAAATTTVTISTWNQLITDVAKYGGYISSPTASISDNNIQVTLFDTSWTVKNTQLDAFDDTDFGAYIATQTTFTYSTPYAQNTDVQTQLKNRALELHLSYSATNYTAYLIARSPTDPSTISGGKQLTIGDSIVHPAPIVAVTLDANGAPVSVFPSTTDPSWQSDYSVVILPKNIVPVFPGGDITAPTAPTLATSKLTPGSVTLKTSGSTDDVGVVGYNFYRVSTYDYGDGYLQTTIWMASTSVVPAGTAFVDTAVEPDSTYTYTARAVDAAGHESLDSAALVVTTPAIDTEPPTAPTVTAGTITTTTATLLVSGSTDNVGVDGYDIYRDGVRVNDALIAAGESFVDTDLTPGTGYSYTAYAYDAAGNESDESAAVLVTTTGSTGDGGNPGGGGGGGGQQDPLPIPGLRASEITDNSVVIELSRAKHDNRVVGYVVYRDGEPVYTITKLGDSFIDLNLDSSHVYTYTVRAQDAEGHLSETSRPLRVTIYSKEEWEYIHGDDANPFWEKSWEKFTTYFGWIPLVGDGIAAISMGVDIGQLLTAIASQEKHEIYDEVLDLLGDGIGFIPIIGVFKNLDKDLAQAIEELDNGRLKETTKSIAFHAAELIYDKLVRPRIEKRLP